MTLALALIAVLAAHVAATTDVATYTTSATVVAQPLEALFDADAVESIDSAAVAVALAQHVAKIVWASLLSGNQSM